MPADPIQTFLRSQNFQMPSDAVQTFLNAKGLGKDSSETDPSTQQDEDDGPGGEDSGEESEGQSGTRSLCRGDRSSGSQPLLIGSMPNCEPDSRLFHAEDIRWCAGPQ